MAVWIYPRRALKAVIQGLSLVVTVPFAALTGFGRFTSTFQGFAQIFSFVPGLIGDYLRIAFYFWTLRECSLYSRISFGSFFAHSSAVVSEGVYIGPYCVLGNCEIGERTQIASHVQILSGRHQHPRGTDGRILAANLREFGRVIIRQRLLDWSSSHHYGRRRIWFNNWSRGRGDVSCGQ